MPPALADAVSRSAFRAMVSLPGLTLDALVQHVRQGVGYAILQDEGMIRFTGLDAASFLHAQTTHDVKQLAAGSGHASALLDRKAHVQAYFSLHRLDDEYWMLVEKNQISTVLFRLETYHFTEKIDMQDCSAAFVLYALEGPKTQALLQRLIPRFQPLCEEYAVSRLTENAFRVSILLFKRSLTGEEGYTIAVPPEVAPAFEEELFQAGQVFNLVQISDEAREVMRIEAGIPRFGIEMTPETLLPETGLEQFAVSYTKGCYLGQEVVARIKTYGSVQKALVGLVFSADSDLPPFDAQCVIGNTAIGVIKSRTWSPTLQAPIAMAYLSREHRVPQKSLAFTAAGKSYTATVVMLPFYRSMQATEKARLCYDNALKRFAEDAEDEAIALLREAIALDPHFSDAYEALGVMLSRREEYDEAIALIKKLAELQPDEVMAHTNLSIFYMKKGMKEEAEQEKALATALSFKKAMATAQQARDEEAERQKRKAALEEKIRMFQEVLALDPEDTLAHYGLGNAFVELERFNEAIPLLERAIAMNPRHTVAYLALGKAYEGIGNPAKAQQTYQAGIEVAVGRGDLMPLQDMQRRLSLLLQTR